MLRRDFETFFLGTAITISTTRAASAPTPKKTAAALYRRGRAPSLAKTSHRRNNLAPAARLVSEGRQSGKGVPALLGRALPAAAARPWQDIFQLGARPPRIGISRQGELLGDELADIEQISRQRLGRIGVGAQYRLAAFRIALIRQVLLEHEAEGVIELLCYRIQGQNTGLHDFSAQPALDHDLAASPAIDGNAGGKGRQSEKAEALGQRRPLAIAGDDIQSNTAISHAVEIDDAFNLRSFFSIR